MVKRDRGGDPGLELRRWRGGMHEESYIERLRADGRAVTGWPLRARGHSAL